MAKKGEATKKQRMKKEEKRLKRKREEEGDEPAERPDPGRTQMTYREVQDSDVAQ